MDLIQGNWISEHRLQSDFGSDPVSHQGSHPNAVLFSLCSFTICLINAGTVLSGKTSSGNWSAQCVKEGEDGGLTYSTKVW